MFTLAILIGIYSYIIFFLGILGLLYIPIVNGVTITYVVFSCILFIVKKKATEGQANSNDKNSNLLKIILILLGLQILVNFIGALGPELAFDALWYHLTLPKMYLLNHRIFHSQIGIFYYSDMPKLAEMLYTGALALQSEILAKIVHFSFGILCLIALYKLSRKFFNQTVSFLCVLIFYSSLVVGWESITAYIDLTRTFFEIMALWAWVNWYEMRSKKWIVISAVMMGLAIETKLLAVGSLIIFTILFIIAFIIEYKPAEWAKGKNGFLPLIRNTFPFILVSLLVPLPWFIFSFIHTGNPVYPFFTNYSVHQSANFLNPIKFFQDIWVIFTRADDPISPVFIGFLPLIVISFSKMSKTLTYIAYYAFLAVLVWYMTPRSGGGRFILPYLPAFSLLSTWCIVYFKKSFLQKILIGFVILCSLISIGYRGIANAKYLPVILGKESKAQFLSDHLNFSFGDFYDTDGYFAKHIKPPDRVGLIGFFNLYYVNFPATALFYSDQKGSGVDYIAVQHMVLPKQYVYWKKIYENKKTGVQLYAKPTK